MFYVRKIKKSNLYKIRDCEATDQLAADVIKQEYSTFSNTLSFWKCDSLDEMADTLKAILLSTTSIENTQFIIVNDEQLQRYQIETDTSEPGKTGYLGFEQLHVNLCNLTYGKIGALIQIYKECSATSALIPTLDKPKVKEYIAEVKRAGLINEDATNEDLLKDIRKYLASSA